MLHLPKRRGVGGIAAFTLLVLVATLLSPMTPAPRADAAVAANFDPGYIISDANMYQGAALDANEVQTFLNSNAKTCVSGYTCLKDYRADSQNRAADGMCGAYAGVYQEAAAQIIAKVGAACGISQKVLLVLLEKEQNLVSATRPTAGIYQKATGYACPDTSVCDSQFYGFFNQVYKAAWQLKRYGASATFNWFPVGKSTQIQFHPDRERCGTSAVTVRNKATAALYYYTPYQPNSAALANMYGTGDACSSYGNRNFWRMYTDWFGMGATNPFGNVEQVAATDGGVQISGWAIDPDTANPIDVHLYVDGNSVAVKANQSRSDVGAGYPGFGSEHGYSYKFPAPPGTHNVCVWGMNTGPGSNVMFGCTTVTVAPGVPFGALESVTAAVGSVTAVGWAIDPDTSAPISVRLEVGATKAPVVADRTRTDIAALWPGFGTQHGYASTFVAPTGNQTVCAFGINVGGGKDVQLGCRVVAVPAVPVDAGKAPIGSLEFVGASPGAVSVSGWSLDPDTAEPIAVHVYVDESSTGHVADKVRNDVGAIYPAYGPRHGFGETIPASPGSHRVCVYGINNGAGVHSMLGCQTVTVPN